MIKSFKDKATADIYHGVRSKIARKIPVEIHKIARRKLDYLKNAGLLDDLRILPNNRLHALSGDKRGFYAISINDQFRIVFKWTPDGVEEVWITDYH